MPTYNLFSIPQHFTKESLQADLSEFGIDVDVKFVKQDNKGRPVLYGVFSNTNWKDEHSFLRYCKIQGMTYKEIKPPVSQTEMAHSTNYDPSRRVVQQHADRLNQSQTLYIGNFGMAYYRESQGYGQKNILDSSLPKQEICRSFSHHFKLKTLYPGLLIGSGYLHPVMTESSKENVVDFQLGFFFDHSTGLPVIPGSSIKGVLRSVFSNPEMINEYLKEISSDLYLEAKAIENLKEVIFEGNIESKPMGIYERDIFHDAFLVAGDDENEDKFLADDYITPHIDELSDPKPIRFMKIRSNVVFQFNFDLKETKIGGKSITAESKKQLFSKILLDFGIGAKTNVGYGHLIGVDE